MRYTTGEAVHLGDAVTIAGDASGVVVGIVEGRKFRPDFVPEEWTYLQSGILVLSTELGLVHYPDDLSQLTLVGHAAKVT